MVDPGQGLRHSIIVGIFCLEGELLKRLGCRAPTKAAVSLETPQGRVSIRDQAKADVSIGEGRIGGAEDCPDKVVVEKWRPDGQLSLFQRQKTVVVPRSL